MEGRKKEGSKDTANKAMHKALSLIPNVALTGSGGTCL